MIAYLSGAVLLKQPNLVIVDVNGVGYEVSIPLSTYYELGEVGEPATLRIHTYVREDAIQLYGFQTGREKELFLRLTSVSGIGPKLALTILSGMGPDDLIPAIRGNDLVRLTSIPGIGKKTAERLVIELRDRLAELAGSEEEGAPAAAPPESEAVRNDAVAALLTLEYQKAQAEKLVARILDEDPQMTVEQVVRLALKDRFR